MFFLNEFSSNKDIIYITNKVYRFKTFKKNIRFLKHNRGLTKFIINRKKYILRKKRTSLQFIAGITWFWTKFYAVSRQNARFFQSFNILNYSLTLSDAGFSYKISYKALLDKLHFNGINFGSLTKRIFWNNSLYILSNSFSYRSVFFNTQVGFMSFSAPKIFDKNIINSGLINDGSLQYSLQLTSINTLKILAFRKLRSRLFLTNLVLVKLMRRVIICLININLVVVDVAHKNKNMF